MSKGNMFLGHARGKVGSVVFYRANGQQITRTRAEVVSNPKSIGQREQRAIFSTVAKLAAVLRPIVDHSWQNISDKVESMRHFRRLALGAIRTAYTAGDLVNLSARNHPSFAPNAVPVSSGTLPSISVDRRQVPADDPAVMIVGNVLGSMTAPTIDFSTLRRIFPGLQPGDQLTVLVMKTEGDMSTGDYVSRVAYDRMVFSPNVQDSDVVYTASDGWDENFLDMSKTTSLTMLDPVIEGSNLYMQANAGDNAILPTAGTIIHSRLAETRNTWEYSSQSLALINIDNFVNNDAALQSYAQAVSNVASTDYLDQATGGDRREGLAGPYMLFRIDDEFNTIRAGVTVDRDEIALRNSAIVLTAFGTEDNELVRLRLAGDTADGNVQVAGVVKGNSATISYNLGNDGNLVGAYQAWAEYHDGSTSVINFRVTAQPEP